MTLISELALSRARIARARENITEFGDVLSRYLDQRPAELKVNIDEQGRGTIRVARREPIPVQLPILLGEALQNLRAGLDNCLYAVAIIDSGMNPPPGGTKLQWPIAVTPKEWTNSRKRLQHLSPHLLTALHRIQPFQAESPGWNCLHILHDLARIDRHRAPHELAMWPEKVKGSFRRDAIHDLTVNQGPVSDDGTVVTFTKTGPEELNPGMLDLDFEFDIDVRDVELAPHPETGKPTRPWGSLDKRLKAMCLAAEEYAEGLVAIAENPDSLLSDDDTHSHD
jgi:hypothetical protein